LHLPTQFYGCSLVHPPSQAVGQKDAKILLCIALREIHIITEDQGRSQFQSLRFLFLSVFTFTDLRL